MPSLPEKSPGRFSRCRAIETRTPGRWSTPKSDTQRASSPSWRRRSLAVRVACWTAPFHPTACSEWPSARTINCAGQLKRSRSSQPSPRPEATSPMVSGTVWAHLDSDCGKRSRPGRARSRWSRTQGCRLPAPPAPLGYFRRGSSESEGAGELQIHEHEDARDEAQGQATDSASARSPDQEAPVRVVCRRLPATGGCVDRELAVGGVPDQPSRSPAGPLRNGRCRSAVTISRV